MVKHCVFSFKKKNSFDKSKYLNNESFEMYKYSGFQYSLTITK